MMGQKSKLDKEETEDKNKQTNTVGQGVVADSAEGPAR